MSASGPPSTAVLPLRSVKQRDRTNPSTVKLSHECGAVHDDHNPALALVLKESQSLVRVRNKVWEGFSSTENRLVNFKSSGLIGSVEFNLLLLSFQEKLIQRAPRHHQLMAYNEGSGISMHTDEFLKPRNGEAMGPRTPKKLSEYNTLDYIVHLVRNGLILL